VRFAPHLIKPHECPSCMDHVWGVARVVLFAVCCGLIGYAFGMRADCPERAMDSLVTIERTCGVGLMVAGVVFVALKVITGVRRDG
jgi:hypothetical protein